MTNNNNLYISYLYNTLNLLCDIFGFKYQVRNKVIVNNSGKELFVCTRNKLTTCVNEFSSKIFNQPSKLSDEDEFLDQNLLDKLLAAFKKQGKVLRLNHLGFCYRYDQVDKFENELSDSAKNAGLNLYRQNSYNNQKWLYVGNTTNWHEPLLEFIPITTDFFDKEQDYWIPHIHINIDTGYFFDEIYQCSQNILQGLRQINPIRCKNITTQARIWLGVVSGINLHLDIGTCADNCRYTRHVLLEEIAVNP